MLAKVTNEGVGEGNMISVFITINIYKTIGMSSFINAHLSLKQISYGNVVTTFTNCRYRAQMVRTLYFLVKLFVERSLPFVFRKSAPQTFVFLRVSTLGIDTNKSLCAGTCGLVIGCQRVQGFVNFSYS